MVAMPLAPILESGVGRKVANGMYWTWHRGLAASLTVPVRLWHLVMDPGSRGWDRRAVVESDRRFKELLVNDLRNVDAGYYPRELLFQFPTAEYLRVAPTGLLEMPRVLLRKHRKRFEEVPEDARDKGYPKYYLRTFHWQTDGWLSDHSAKMYDVGVEFLFMGTADVMRRMTIPPLVDATRRVERPRILDVACGTGRLMRQLHAALPEAHLYGLDLSPNYLKAAAKLLDGTDVSLVNENAEDMPFADETFDALVSVFLFHELPKDARRNVMREAFRVLAPGGRFVVLDSGQAAGNEALEVFFSRFPKLYHEPYYKGYYRDDLGAALRECGFEVDSEGNHLISRMVVARKPVG